MKFRCTAMFAGYVATSAVLAMCLALCPQGVAQSTSGRVLGSVTDASGAAVTGATVVVTDTERGTSRTLTTDDAGAYVAADLNPGNYKIHVEARGFKSVERPSVHIEVATDVRADFTLSPGEVSETVVVQEEVPLLNTTSATLGGTLSNKEINDLPLNGRNYENLLQLRPGVMRYPGGGFSTTSTDGLRAEDNAYFIDGLFNSEPFSGQGIINGAGIAGDSATILPIDAIQEFNVQENAPAEYGWKPGAVINVGLKSGTNSIHGTAFAFGRDGDVLDARNYFNAEPAAKTPRTLEQFGGSLGGAIIKDKAFFFGAYEGQRYDVGNNYSVSTPTTVGLPTPSTPTCTSVAGDCANSIPNAIADLLANHIPISHASQLISGCTVSGAGAVTCNGTGFPTNNTQSINVVQGFPNNVGVDNVIAKVDYTLSQRNSISGMYFFGNNSGTVEDFPELQSKWRSDIHTRAQVVGGNWIWTPNAQWVNEARVGYNRLYQPTLPGDLDTPASAYGLNTGVSGPDTGGLPRIGFAGAFVPGLGGFKWPKFQGPDSITQFIDHVSRTFGKHAFKFGGEVHRDEVTGGAFGNARGSITFLGGVALPASTALEDFFAGDPFKASVQVGNPNRTIHNWAYAGFVQDDWRATRNLTINAGLRYEFNSVISEAHNQLGNFDPNSATGLIQEGRNGVSGPYNPDHKDFAPRLGFAWDVTGKGNTVLRGGAGLVYETINWEALLAFNNAFGLNNVPTGAIIDAAGDTAGGTITASNIAVPPVMPQWDSGVPIYGSNVSTATPNCFLSPCPIMSVDRNITTPYVWNWTLSLQHAFNPNLSLEVAYVGNHGGNLTGIRDINQPPVGSGWPAANVVACTQAALAAGSGGTYPTVTNTACQDDTANEIGPYATKFPYLSNIFQMANVYRSNYDGLQVTLNSRNYHGLSMVAGYTFAHALDDVGANWDFGYGAGLPQDSYNVGREYANSDFDIRQRFTLSLTYAIPGRSGSWQMLEGWELNSIVTLQSPQFWGPIDLGTDAAGVGPLPVSPPANEPIRWSFFGKTSDFKSGPNPIPYFAGNNSPTNPTNNAACNSQALAVDGGTPGAATESLAFFGCYAQGSSIMIPPPLGQFGNMSRNMFPDSGFKDFDFSVAKNWHLGERLHAQFRAEFFNIFNHPNFANPYGGQNGFGLNDPSARPFGCGCATPDVAAANPVIGSGGPRAVQLGLKFIF
ncbi:MAG TPA: carboxypeptidase regulatory-like domain-containing protein [Candidatus Deferrimicrobiaceae bacterium]|nr:carboxypeptidase regulatory-like domain-containing protein [Candidatus Deferrimicrobiaceae bacterium]